MRASYRRRRSQLAREAEIDELLLTHISGRYKAEEILAEEGGVFPRIRMTAVRPYLGRPPRQFLSMPACKMAVL